MSDDPEGAAAYSTNGGKFGGAVTGSFGGTVTWSYATANFGGDHTFDYAGTWLSTNINTEIQRAFSVWSSVANIDFVQVADSASVDIRFGIDNGDGLSNTLATCYYSGNGSTRDAEIAFDNADLASTRAELLDIAAHEIGHAIGLNHENRTQALMNAVTFDGVFQGVMPDDVAGARLLYGTRNAWLTGGSFVGTEDGEFVGGTDLADLAYGWGGADCMVGYAGDDRLYGSAGDDTQLGGDGTDWMDGGLGNDSLDGGAGNDVLGGADGSDRMFGQDGDDYVLGGTEADSLSGGNGADVVRGQAGNDTLDGGAGNDRLWGDRGNDMITGGAGADSFNFFPGAGVSTVTDFRFAEGDRIGIENGMTWSITAQSGNAVIDFGNGTMAVLQGVSAGSIGADWFVLA